MCLPTIHLAGGVVLARPVIPGTRWRRRRYQGIGGKPGHGAINQDGDSVLRRSVFGRTAAADMGEIAQTAHRQTNPRVFAGFYRGTRDSAVNSRIRLQE